MLKNKRGDMTPYNMGRKPSKQNPFLLPMIWGGSYLLTRQFCLKITKKKMDDTHFQPTEIQFIGEYLYHSIAFLGDVKHG